MEGNLTFQHDAKMNSLRYQAASYVTAFWQSRRFVLNPYPEPAQRS